MAYGHLLGYPLAVAVGSVTAVLGGLSSALLAMENDRAAAWAALLVAAGGFVTAATGLLVPIFRLWVDSLRLKEHLDEAKTNIVELREKAARDRATIRRNFSLIKGLMTKMSHSTVMEIVRIQDEKEAMEAKESPGKSLIIKPFDLKDAENEVTDEYEPPSDHDLGLPEDQR